MKESDEPIHYLLINLLQEIEEYLAELPFVMETQKPSTVSKIIFKQLVKRLLQAGADFNAISVFEVADWEFEVTINSRVRSSLVLKQKGAVQ